MDTFRAAPPPPPVVLLLSPSEPMMRGEEKGRVVETRKEESGAEPLHYDGK
jgi:hypothetical protein